MIDPSQLTEAVIAPKYDAMPDDLRAVFDSAQTQERIREIARNIGMTDDETHRTGELLISLAGRHSLIVIEHDMTFVKQIAQDRKVTVLHQGSVLAEGSIEDVQRNPQVVEVYLGE